MISRTLQTALALVLAIPVVARGQLVRGTVHERTTGVTIAGALVTLERVVSDPPGAVDTVHTVLTGARGEYAIYAPSPGSYRISVKRIGVRPFATAGFELAAGMTLEQNIDLDVQAATLSNVVVKGVTPCSMRREKAARLTSLWEDARAALTATTISSRDSLVRARFVRYVREVDPRNMQVVSESLHVFDSTDVGAEPYFGSVSGDSLSKMGYWRRLDDRTAVYYAPDAAALLSEAFVSDHCFDVIAGAEERRGLVGLAFQPTRFRSLWTHPPDIRGTIWLDAQSSELRFVEFSWTKMPGESSRTKAGGVVYFSRTDGGPWIIPRWSMLMPRQLLEFRTNGDIVVSSSTRLGLIEEGGMLVIDSLRLSEPPGTIFGFVRDSAGRPLAGARVRLVGTRYAAVSDSAGRYALEQVPPGWHTIVVDHEAYRARGVRVGEMEVLLDAAMIRRLSFRAPPFGAPRRTRDR